MKLANNVDFRINANFCCQKPNLKKLRVGVRLKP